MSSPCTTILRAVNSALYRKAELQQKGPIIIITHRLWVPGTCCMPGEEVARAGVLHKGQEIPLRASLQLRLLIDYFAHQRFGQSAGQLAAGMNAQHFYGSHATNCRGRVFPGVRATRNSVKQRILRLRDIFQELFDTEHRDMRS